MAREILLDQGVFQTSRDKVDGSINELYSSKGIPSLPFKLKPCQKISYKSEGVYFSKRNVTAWQRFFRSFEGIKVVFTSCIGGNGDRSKNFTKCNWRSQF